MKFNVSVAILLSIVVVGAATWKRFSISEKISNNGTVELVGTSDSYTKDDLLKSFQEASVPTAVTTSEEVPLEENLNNTDIVTRNLLSSYIGLESSGQTVDQASLQNLALQYSNDITKYHIFTKIGIADIVIVADNTPNAKAYMEGFQKIFADFANTIKASTMDAAMVTEFSNTYQAHADTMLTIYEGMATKFKALPVPTSLAQLHLDLINSYLSDAQAMRSAHTLESDPITTLAGMSALKENADREAEILSLMAEILKNKLGLI